jgi:hypothetical protein
MALDGAAQVAGRHLRGGLLERLQRAADAAYQRKRSFHDVLDLLYVPKGP